VVAGCWRRACKHRVPLLLLPLLLLGVVLLLLLVLHY
jgi:hypothetical protein